jgi:hypothetical protein
MDSNEVGLVCMCVCEDCIVWLRIGTGCGMSGIQS